MGRIILARHGEDEDNAAGILNGHRDMPLTERGLSQARTFVQRLLKDQIDVGIVLSSPLRRASKTAVVCATEFGVPISIIGSLIERNFGILTGKPVSGIMKYATKTFKGDKILYFLEAQDSEIFPNLLLRAEIALGEIIYEMGVRQVENSLVVAHGDICKMLWAVHYKKTWQEALATPYMDNCDYLVLE